MNVEVVYLDNINVQVVYWNITMNFDICDIDILRRSLPFFKASRP